MAKPRPTSARSKKAARSADPFDLTEAPGHLIRRAQQLHTTLWGELVGTELTSVQFAIFAALDAEPGIDQRTLGARVSLDPSSLAEVCRRLVERGLVSRARDAADGRRYVLSLTRTGQQALRDVTPRVDEVGARLLDDFSPEEASELMRLLSRLVGA
jgi:DNA-binding MarR family transcriptional regulator